MPVQEDDWQYTQEAVNGPLVVGAAMVPLADAEKLATALRDAIGELDRIVVACDNGARPADKLTFIRRVAATARDVARAAHPREETTG